MAPLLRAMGAVFDEVVGPDVARMRRPLHLTVRWPWAINAGDPAKPWALTVAARGSANEILLADDETARNVLIPSIAPGTRLMLRGPQSMGTVTNVTYSGGRWVIKGNWTATVR